ncbi:hypothetical protein [Haliea sp. E17]|uniref:hypothetical protein n=1 Tax=Haliea sp. E17 TaxID=3401576 RepID=UPI003AAD5632
MKYRNLMAAVMIAGCVVPPFALAQGQGGMGSQQMVHQQGHIYGSELMTEQERNAYRDQMRAAKTEQERDQIRAAHHEAMRQRAEAMGKQLPDDPPEYGGHMGMHGQGQGSGQGAGMQGSGKKNQGGM